MSKIRVVDIANIGLDVDKAGKEDLEKVGKELSKAFEEIGFVFVKNHGIAENTICQAREASKQYFKVFFLEIKGGSTLICQRHQSMVQFSC